MGYDIHITARHRLNTDSLEALAQDLSKALDINIEYGYEHNYDVDVKKRVIKYASKRRWVSLGNIKRGPYKVNYALIDERHEQREIINALGGNLDKVKFKDVHDVFFKHPTLFQLCWQDNSGGDIFYMYISESTLVVSMRNEPFRWDGFYMNFDQQWASEERLEILNEYRRTVKRVLKALGSEYIYFYPDQGTPSLIDEMTYQSWEKMEEYILSKSYITDYCMYTQTKVEDYRSEIMDISSFMTAEEKVYSEYYEDVFRDDFSDLED